MSAVPVSRAVWVHSAAEMGKDWLLARLILWFASTRFPAKVIATSSSEKQIKQVLWGEIDAALRQSQIDLGFVKKYLLLEVPDGKGSSYNDHFVSLMVAKDPETFQGVHLPPICESRPNEFFPRVMFMFDEGSNIKSEFYDAAESQAHILLVVANPIRAKGKFKSECKRGDEPDPQCEGRFNRRVVHIDGDDSPNVKLGKKMAEAGVKGPYPSIIPGVLSYSDYIYRETKWDNFNRTTRLHGLFYEGDDTQMFPPDRMDAAENAYASVSMVEYGKRGPFYLGVDVAGGGRDSSCWVVLDRLGIYEMIVKSTPDLTQIPDITLAVMARHRIESKNVCIDATGLGEGPVASLRRKGRQVRGVSFSQSASRPKIYCNVRAEMYMEAGKRFDVDLWVFAKDVAADGTITEQPGNFVKCMSYNINGQDRGEYEMLREELQSMPLNIDGDGRIWLPPKNKDPRRPNVECLHDILGRSPDRADAFVLAVHAMRRKETKMARRVIGPVASMSDDYGALEDRPTSLTPMPKPEGSEDRPRTSSLAERIFGKGGM